MEDEENKKLTTLWENHLRNEDAPTQLQALWEERLRNPERNEQLAELTQARRKGLWALGVATWAVGFIGLTGIGSAVAQYFYTADIDKRVEAAKADLDSKLSLLQDASQDVITTPGTVCVWPGILPEKTSTFWSYWRVCDGGETANKLELPPVLYGAHKALWKCVNGLYGNPNVVALGDSVRIKLPDFRGQFLRGLGGPNETGTLGRAQPHATAMPKSPFTTLTAGSHTHSSTDLYTTDAKGDGGGTAFNGHFQGNAGDARFLHKAGSHTHTVAGGDKETRPVNYPVYWLIRIR